MKYLLAGVVCIASYPILLLVSFCKALDQAGKETYLQSKEATKRMYTLSCKFIGKKFW